MNYASLVLAHAARTNLKPLQIIQSCFHKIAVEGPWFMKNVGLHDDLELDSISKFQSASVRHFEMVARHENSLVLATGNR